MFWFWGCLSGSVYIYSLCPGCAVVVVDGFRENSDLWLRWDAWLMAATEVAGGTLAVTA